MEIEHFIHPEHPLILIDLKDSKTRGLINEAHKKINREKQRSESADYAESAESAESADDVSILCVLCGNEMLDTSYSCIDCDIHLHKLCAKLPTEMMHPSHPQHPLTLADDIINMDRYFKIQHFVHPEHPLILIDLKDSETRGLIEAQKKINWEKQRSEPVDDVSISCVLCRNEMLDTSYSCIDCDIHLHKLCAKLPTEMRHPSHHKHPLTLTDHHRRFECDICSNVGNGFSYYCRSCDFDVDVKCASKRETINHKGHPHPLYPFLKTVLSRCDACGTEHSAATGGVSYMCNTCDFWIHEDCATLPATVTYDHHVHPLSLVVYHPFDIPSLSRCSICKNNFLKHWSQWIYECGGCFHRVHTICLAKTLIAERNKTYEVDVEIDRKKVFRLPESFKYDDLVAQMIKHITIHYGGENTALPLISHFSHKHPLTLIHNDINKEDVLCNACVLPVSTAQVPYYSCTVCNNYALHEWCAKLPNELLQHPAHPHPLILTGAVGKDNVLVCPACVFSSNGFSYRCDTAACRSWFAMDIKCLLPPAILHKAHEHPLILVENCAKEGCVACRYTSDSLAYGCVSCCFYLHNACALKPIAIMHRYDKHHPFTSTSVEPVENRADDDDDRADDDDDRADDDKYVCEFCEEDIDPKWWFHQCLDCDLSACSECIFPKHGGKSHLNPHLTYSSPVHHHPLSYVKLDRTNNTSLCALCQDPIHRPFLLNREYALQCAQCKVMFHMYDWDCRYPKSRFPLVLQEGPSCH